MDASVLLEFPECLQEQAIPNTAAEPKPVVSLSLSAAGTKRANRKAANPGDLNYAAWQRPQLRQRRCEKTAPGRKIGVLNGSSVIVLPSDLPALRITR
jgi:hypothetical protein